MPGSPLPAGAWRSGEVAGPRLSFDRNITGTTVATSAFEGDRVGSDAGAGHIDEEAAMSEFSAQLELRIQAAMHEAVGARAAGDDFGVTVFEADVENLRRIARLHGLPALCA